MKKGPYKGEQKWGRRCDQRGTESISQEKWRKEKARVRMRACMSLRGITEDACATQQLLKNAKDV